MGPILDALWRNMLALLNPLLKSIMSITTKTITQSLVGMLFLLMIEAVLSLHQLLKRCAATIAPTLCVHVTSVA